MHILFLYQLKQNGSNVRGVQKEFVHSKVPLVKTQLHDTEMMRV